MYNKKINNKGFTLIETVVVLLILSLAVIPIVKLASNKSSTNAGVYTTSSSNKELVDEQAIANSIIQKVLSKNKTDVEVVNPLIDAKNMHLGFNTYGNFVELDPTYGLPTASSPLLAQNIPTGTPSSPISDPLNRKYSYPKYQYKNSNIYYQWVIYDATTQMVGSTYKNFIPTGNNLVKAVLNVFSGDNAKTSTESKLSISTYLFQNTTTGNIQNFHEKMGIILVHDISGSMVNSQVENWYLGGLGGTSVWTKDNPTGAVLGTVASSNIDSYYDPYSVSAPYLTYRPNIDDIFFGAKDDDNPITPYDERYDPCSTYTFPYAVSGTLGPTFCDSANVATPFDDLASIFSNKSVFMPVPSRPSVDYATNKFPADNYFYFDKQCLDPNDLNKSTCKKMDKNNRQLDVYFTNLYRANAFASKGDDNVLKNTLSRMEAARTAMLSFVETIETDPTLVNNFRIGYLAFSNSAASGTYQPHAISTLSKSDAGGEFMTLKSTLFMINRACKYDTTNDNLSVVCPTGKKPIVTQNLTNISDSLYAAKKMFENYEKSTGETFSKKLVVLLTDGQPTAGITSVKGMGGVAKELAADNINIYSIGLLIDDPDHKAACNILAAIKSADANNTTTLVNSFGDLTSVFENIAQEAEAYMLTQIQERYGFLNN